MWWSKTSSLLLPSNSVESRSLKNSWERLEITVMNKTYRSVTGSNSKSSTVTFQDLNNTILVQLPKVYGSMHDLFSNVVRVRLVKVQKLLVFVVLRYWIDIELFLNFFRMCWSPDATVHNYSWWMMKGEVLLLWKIVWMLCSVLKVNKLGVNTEKKKICKHAASEISTVLPVANVANNIQNCTKFSIACYTTWTTHWFRLKHCRG